MEDLAGRRKTLERERLRLEKLLGQHPQWRMMRAADERPARVDGVWQFPGLNRVQASALRESLVFRAYQDVLEQLANLDERRHGVGVTGGGVTDSGDVAMTEAQQDAGRETPGESAEKDDGPDAGLAPVSTHPVIQDVASRGPTFRTKVKIKPAGSMTSPAGGVAPDGRTAQTDAPAVSEDERPAASVGAMEVSASGGGDTARVRPAEQPRAVEGAGHEGPSDDLTRIRSINRALAGRLRDAGLSSFAQIAAWDGDDLRAIARELELGSRIWREGWIEQAAQLVLKGGGTLPEIGGRRAAGGVAAGSAARQADDSEPDAKKPVAAETSVVAAQRPAATESDGAVTTPDSVAVPATIALPIARLAGRPQTAGDGQDQVGAADVQAPAPQADGAQPGGGTAEPDGAVAPAETKDAVTSVAQVTPAPPVRRAAIGTRQKAGRRAQRLPAPSVRRLSYIRGLSDDMAERLRASGVRSLNEIAAWQAADVEWFQVILGDEARISADQWIEQAALLAEGRWTAYALALVQGTLPAVVARPAPVVARRRRESDTAAPIIVEADRVAVEPPREAARVAGARETPDAQGEAQSSSDVSDRTGSRDQRETAEPAEPRAAEVDATVVARRAALAAATVVVPFVAARRDDPAETEAAAPASDGATDGDVGQIGETDPGPFPAAGGDGERDAAQPDRIDEDASAGGEPGSSEARDPVDAGRPAASLFADDLVEKLLPNGAAVGASRRAQPDTAPRHIPETDTASPTGYVPEPGPVAAGGEVPAIAENDGDAGDEAAARGADSFAPDDVDEFAALGDDRDEEAEVAIVRPDDDIADAEALVIRRPGAREADETGLSPLSAADRAVEASLVEVAREPGVAPPKAVAAGHGEADDAPDWGDDDADGFTPLGEEASVRIVSRRGERPSAGGGEAPRETTERGDTAAAEGDERHERAPPQRLGFTPEFLARRMLQREDEADEDYAGYRDEVEEATVTIIRAKGQEEPESAIVPDQAANDQTDIAPESPSKEADAGAGKKIKKTVLGSRFLKALTGD